MKLLFVLLGVLSLHCVAGQHDFADLFSKSLLFFKAERSGEFTDNVGVEWRWTSAMLDGQDRGKDLTGGWYDAGDHVKFGFPMAWSTTTAAWGIHHYGQTLADNGLLDAALDSIKWPLDYFLKCDLNPESATIVEFVGQVADGYADHAEWTRPETMNPDRPSFVLSPAAPGSDLAGETSAALAVGYLVFRSQDPSYADTLLVLAKKLHAFAYDYRGIYTASIPADDFYGSTGYEDELAWSALWIYVATGEQVYMDRALEFYSDGLPWAYSWDNKHAGVQLLMYQVTQNQMYAGHVEAFLRSWMPGGGLTYTPGGLAHRDIWGPLRYTANTAAIALIAADSGIITTEARDWATGQIDYMLGNNPMDISYVIGYTDKFPKKPHHRGASCNPDHSVECNWDEYYSPNDNPSDLVGALVGGPDVNDNYVDARDDYITNEVANDYNAGFQTALAGMLTIQQKQVKNHATRRANPYMY